MSAYYNEMDPYAAQWLKNLIKAGYIADGEVDQRSIEDVKSEELRDFTQCHFFAGIGIWSLALRKSGWSDDQPVWTASCPCQPFSNAGKQLGFEDRRHLWPHVKRLIRECKPAIVFGEQVEKKSGLEWLEIVQADVEAEGYTFAAVTLNAAGVQAPNVRDRIYWVADTKGERGRERGQMEIGYNKESGGPSTIQFANFWSNYQSVTCADGRKRLIEPSFLPLVNGDSTTMGRLRAYGNAINPEVAQLFIESYMSC